MTGDGAIRLRASALPELARRVAVPGYDRPRVTAGLVHFGVGGFHRAHQAMYLDRLMNAGHSLEWGVCGVGVMAADRRMKAALDAQDALYTLVAKPADGRIEPRIIGSIGEYLLAPDDPERVVERLADPAIRIVSLTITEGAYDLGALDEPARDAGQAASRTTFGLIVDGLARRRKRGIAPFTVLSCDNLQANGRAARAAVLVAARYAQPGIVPWIEDAVAFPSAMVDRITPVTTDEDRADLRERVGIDDRWPVVCEPFAQWVLEDRFPAGRPPFEDAGVHLVEDVVPYELMKVRLLNASHQVLGYLGVLMGHRMVHEAVEDPVLGAFLEGYLEQEATPTLAPVPGVDVGDYRRTLLERFANPAIADTLARQCAMASDRIPTFVLPVVRAQLEAGGPVERAAAVVAGWARYANGVDEDGRPIEVVDRIAERVTAAARRAQTQPAAFLADREVFGDLGDDPRFAAAFADALRSLYERGARATLAQLAGAGR